MELAGSWRGRPTGFDAERYKARNVVERAEELPGRGHVDLRPVQPGGPPVLLGGLNAMAMTRIGRRAAGWLPLYGMPAEVAAQLWHTARHAAEQAGRDPDLLRRELRINLNPGQDARHAADAAAQARDSGIEGAILDFNFATSSVEESLSMAADAIARIGSPSDVEADALLGDRHR